MRSLVLGLLLPCLTVPAMAQAVFKGDDFMVFFFRTPCEIPPLAQYLGRVGEARKAVIVHEGKRIPACFAKDEDGDYLLINHEGRGAWIPGQAVESGL